jgi:hypothetical protein
VRSRLADSNNVALTSSSVGTCALLTVGTLVGAGWWLM